MNVIQKENRKEGARDWQLTRVRPSHGDRHRSPWIEGYCSHQSVQAGDQLSIMVSTDPAAAYHVEIFRLGYYGGRGARLVEKIGPLQGEPQAEPEMGEDRLIECGWEPGVTLKVPDDWLSGVYLGRLTTVAEEPLDGSGYWQSYVVFIVRDDRPADVLFQCPDNTWLAYNRWPQRHSLYDDGERNWYLGHETQVSFDRPYGRYRQIYQNPQSVGSGSFLCWEFPMAYWLEREGYDVTYCSNSDLLTPDRGLNCRTFISPGHDEYWDLKQFESVSHLRDEGVNLLFLSGNSVCYVSPFSPSTDGRPNRIIRRAGPYGGFAEDRHESAGPYPVTGPDEGYLVGARNVRPINGGGDWTVVKPEHWIFEGTGMEAGESVPGLVGWEYMGAPADIEGLEVVASDTAWRGGVEPQQWTATIYPGPKDNFVFNAATIWWGLGLSRPPGHLPPWSHFNRPHGPDPRVQQITHNLLRRALR